MTKQEFLQLTKLSQLLSVALDDLDAIEKNPLYRIDMSSWHEYMGQQDGCAVCLAGCVLANTLQHDYQTTLTVYLEGLSERETEIMYALDDLRWGAADLALARLFDLDNRTFIRKITPYKSNPLRFKTELRQLASDLANAGY